MPNEIPTFGVHKISQVKIIRRNYRYVFGRSATVRNFLDALKDIPLDSEFDEFIEYDDRFSIEFTGDEIGEA